MLGTILWNTKITTTVLEERTCSDSAFKLKVDKNELPRLSLNALLAFSEIK